MDWKPRPIRMPDEHLPLSGEGWQCWTCKTPWPCTTAQPYLHPGKCQCGAITQRETNGPRYWHVGPQCWTKADAMDAYVKELREKRAAYPRYPPSHYYPAKPHRPQRQRPRFPRHTPTGPGDVRPGTWLWVKPTGLHPGWGDIHHLAMLTRRDEPKCEVWLHADGTVHEVRADRLLLTLTGRAAASAAGLDSIADRWGRLLPEWRWLNWTVAQHLAHQRPEPAPPAEPVQEELFPARAPS